MVKLKEKNHINDRGESFSMIEMPEIKNIINKKIRLFKYDRAIELKNFIHSRDESYQINIIPQITSAHFGKLGKTTV